MFYIQFICIKIKYFTCYVIKIKYILTVISVIGLQVFFPWSQKNVNHSTGSLGARFMFWYFTIKLTCELRGPTRIPALPILNGGGPGKRTCETNGESSDVALR